MDLWLRAASISSLVLTLSEPCAQVHAAAPRMAWQPERRGAQAEVQRSAPASSDGDEDGGAPPSAEQAAQEVLHACGRMTSGSLDDVAGLHDIKQLLREARAPSTCTVSVASPDASRRWPANPPITLASLHDHCVGAM